MSESRSDPRHGLVQEVRVKLPDWQVFARFHTENISRGGAFLRGDGNVGIGDPIVLILTLPDGRELRLPGRVAHVLDAQAAAQAGRSPGIGVQFDPLPTATSDGLVALCKWVERQADPRTANVDQGRTQKQEFQSHAILQKLKLEMERINSVSVQEVLGIDDNATTAKLLDAFADYSKRFHPSLFVQHPGEVQQLAAAVFGAAERAYQHLRSDDEMASLKRRTGTFGAVTLAQLTEHAAEERIEADSSGIAIARLRRRIASRDYRVAMSEAGEYIQKAGGKPEPEMVALMELCQGHLKKATSLDEAIGHFKRAQMLSPDSPEIQLELRRALAERTERSAKRR